MKTHPAPKGDPRTAHERPHAVSSRRHQPTTRDSKRIRPALLISWEELLGQR